MAASIAPSTGSQEGASAGLGESYQSRRFANACPDPDFRYRSKADALLNFENATYVTRRQGANFEVWGTCRHCDRRAAASDWTSARHTAHRGFRASARGRHNERGGPSFAKASAGIRLRFLDYRKSCEARSAKQDGGAEGNRTPDLYNAIVALSQLSYGPQGVGMAPAAPDSNAGLRRPRKIRVAGGSRQGKTGRRRAGAGSGRRLRPCRRRRRRCVP